MFILFIKLYCFTLTLNLHREYEERMPASILSIFLLQTYKLFQTQR